MIDFFLCLKIFAFLLELRTISDWELARVWAAEDDWDGRLASSKVGSLTQPIQSRKERGTLRNFWARSKGTKAIGTGADMSGGVVDLAPKYGGLYIKKLVKMMSIFLFFFDFFSIFLGFYKFF